MATIFSFSGSFFGTRSFTDPSTWYGGIVPTASDNVFIRGVRTTVNGALMYWPGTASFINVASNIGFPFSGSLYTYTDRNVEVKIDYKGLNGNTQFTECVIDKSFSAPWGQGDYNSNTISFPDKRGGQIPNGAFILFRPGIVSLSGSLTASVYQLTIENGGEFVLQDTASYRIGNYVNIGDGAFRASGSATIIWNNIWSSSRYDVSTYYNQSNGFGSVASLSCSFFNLNNVPFSQLTLEGPEVRTNTFLIQTSSKGDSFISVSTASNFEVGDWIFVGEEEVTSSREDDNTRIVYGQTVSSEDECFYVAAKDTGSIPHRLFVQVMNGLEGKVFATASSTEIIVDEERYQVGDKVVINGQTRIITNITNSYDHLLASYDFTNPTASLTDWETDTSRSPFLANWRLSSSLGLVSSATPATPYRLTVLKNIFRDNVKIEATIQNNVFGRNISRYGIIIHADPDKDFDLSSIPASGVPYRTHLYVNPVNSTVVLTGKNTVVTDFLNKPILMGVRSIEDSNKFTLECSRGFTKGYINDIKIAEIPNFSGALGGRVGLITENPYVLYKDFKVYAKCQKITLDSSITGVKANDIIYETGIEYPHKINDKVIKLSSFIDNELAHKNLAFAYRGASEFDNNNIFPYIFSTNNDGTARNGIGIATHAGGLLVNDNSTIVDFGTNANPKSITLDFSTPITFTNFGIIEFFLTYYQTFTSSLNGGISFSGSNDSKTWIPITGGIQDPRGRLQESTIRDWDFSTPQTYRYLRFQTQGITNAVGAGFSGSFRAIYVRSGSLNQISVNNASDFNIGDRITIYPKNQMSDFARYWDNQGLNAENALIRITVSGSSSLLGEDFNNYYTITGKSGRILTLNKKVYNHAAKGSHVIKINRTLNFSGSFDSNNIRTGRFWGNHSTNNISKITFKNVGMQHISDSYPYIGYSGTVWNMTYTNFWNPFKIQGCSFYHSPMASSWQNSVQEGPQIVYPKHHIHARHNNFIISFRYQNFRPYESSVGLPTIIVGNTFHNSGGASGISNFSYTNYSYNVNYYSNDFSGFTYSEIVNRGGGIGLTTQLNIFNGTFYKHNRNLYRSLPQYAVSISPLYSPTEQGIVYQVKNNKIESGLNSLGSTGAGRSQGNSLFQSPSYQLMPFERMLFPNRGGWDGNHFNYGTNNVGSFYWANPSWDVGQGGWLSNGYLWTYLKDYNRYGYNIWSHPFGLVIKENNDEWYKFYNYYRGAGGANVNGTFPTLLLRQPFIYAQIHVVDNVTCSFDLSFDYYTDMSQFTQTAGNFTANFTNGVVDWNVIQITGGTPPYNYSTLNTIPVSASYAGALSAYISKNNKELRFPKPIIKSLTPQHYEERFVLEGKGIYVIGLAQDISAQGFTAIKNISSKFNNPSNGKVNILHNYFSMKYFDGLKDIQSRTISNQQPNLKFRIKSQPTFGS
jgi:hypothetical protein